MKSALKRSCLEYLTRYQQASGGVSPTVREIKDAINIRGMAGVLDVLHELEMDGAIRRWPNGRRRIQVLKPFQIYHEGNAEVFAWDNQAKALRRR